LNSSYVLESPDAYAWAADKKIWIFLIQTI
jgi:hypothetical protein